MKFCAMEAYVSFKRLENLQCEPVFGLFYLSFLKGKKYMLLDSALYSC